MLMNVFEELVVPGKAVLLLVAVWLPAKLSYQEPPVLLS